MLRYSISRVLWFIPTLLAMIAVTFVIMTLTPGSPFDLANSNGINPETIKNLEHLYGLDKPIYERFGIYVWNSLHGDFGVSYQYRPD